MSGAQLLGAGTRVCRQLRLISALTLDPSAGRRHEILTESFEFVVNGRTVVDALTDMPVLWVLRDLLGLTGTKFGAVSPNAAHAPSIWIREQFAPACLLFPRSRGEPSRPSRRLAKPRRDDACNRRGSRPKSFNTGTVKAVK
jgi:hypothetical protein